MKGTWKQSLLQGRVPRLVALIIVAGGNLPTHAETLHIRKLATYANPERVRQQVREECTPEVMLPVVMREEILKRTSVQDVVLIEDLSAVREGLAMEISILSLHAPPGSGWTTEKRFMRVKTVVYRNGVVAGEYVRYLDTQGGGDLLKKLFKNRNTCQIVERLERDISEATVERFKVMKVLPSVPPQAPEAE